MWKPAPRTDGKNLEYLELYNSNPWFQDISGYQIVCADMNYTFPPGHTDSRRRLSGHGGGAGGHSKRLWHHQRPGAIHRQPEKIRDAGIARRTGRGAVDGALLGCPPWPVAADGTGHSLVLANPTYGEGDPRAWDISDTVGGSPGQMEAFRPSPLRNVVINEFLRAHGNPPDYDYMELYNHSTNSVDISGCILTDDPATNKFVIPAGTVIPARGIRFFTANPI